MSFNLEIAGDTLITGTTEGPAAPEGGGVQLQSGLVIPYRDYKKLAAAELAMLPPGTLVQDVKPNELFALQDWLEPEKALRAMGDFIGGRCMTQPIAYAREILGKPALIIGEGVHRSGCAYINGIRIDVEIQLPLRELDLRRIFRVPKLVGLNPTIARIWQES